MFLQIVRYNSHNRINRILYLIFLSIFIGSIFIARMLDNFYVSIQGNTYGEWEGQKGFKEKGLPTIGIVTTLLSFGTSAALSGSVTFGNALFSTISIGNNINSFGEGNKLMNLSSEAQKGINLVGISYDLYTITIGKNPGAIPSLFTNSKQSYQGYKNY